DSGLLRGSDESKYKLSGSGKRRRSSPAELSLYEDEEWTRKQPAGFFAILFWAAAKKYENGLAALSG
ncbi:MAG: hypothetical protein RI565_10695, partial [Schleiferiaceae bacterium]|nr:hypothetical protein [Schleiferiaceae bacterium]